ncbi:spermidine/putrescine ABC transporter substrate-binding protein [Leptolyngbya sp. NK1-12]|uniref:Spermidine/putrescine ABC transporter substrate-binding protein n=1 Tax=Leptolyngbya sp. NK1-12 TaxID=2547451 RepID=A0AA96WBG3_9CYAN|nr:spermidine/putrescine ABC transporter substrate-binding protein [Leptolyngbya sp. NK1-12]WNZ22118.1 spermidine/putrescine ABC transporter substrate-binding protein [Leptolyngbya sp. NK1-12]
MRQQPKQPSNLTSTRRRFLQFSAAFASTVALGSCQRSILNDSSFSQSSSNDLLRIYTWADYSNEEVYQQFTEQTGIKIIADVYDSNETMLTKLLAGGGNQYSIIYPSDYMVKQMIELKLLTQIDHTRLQGLNQLLDKWKNPPYDPHNTHSIPVSWGTTGLIYNTEVLQSKPTDWEFLWREKQALSGRITLLDDVREVMGATLRSIGYSYNATNPKELEAAYQKLRELKPALASFESFGWEDSLVAGDLALCMTYSIIGNSLPTEHPHLKYVIPQSGTSVWTDTLVIPKTAPNLNAAYAWINFMLKPENAAFAVEKLMFATPNKAAFEQLPSELKENTNLYPTSETLAKYETIAPIGKAIDLYDEYWTELKSI